MFVWEWHDLLAWNSWQPLSLCFRTYRNLTKLSAKLRWCFEFSKQWTFSVHLGVGAVEVEEASTMSSTFSPWLLVICTRDLWGKQSRIFPWSFLLANEWELMVEMFRLMMLSVMKHTKSPVKFWLLKNYLSPQFKVPKKLQPVMNYLAIGLFFQNVISCCFRNFYRLWPTNTDSSTNWCSTNGQDGCINRLRSTGSCGGKTDALYNCKCCVTVKFCYC